VFAVDAMMMHLQEFQEQQLQLCDCDADRNSCLVLLSNFYTDASPFFTTEGVRNSS
jgi:hypothetical protein